MLSNFLCSINFMSLLTTTSSYVIATFGSSHGAAGFAASIIVAGALTARLLAVRYSLAVGYKRMLVLGMIVVVISSFLYLAADNFLLFCIIRFVNGFAFGVSMNTTITIVATIIPKNRSGEGVGYFSMSQIVGTAIGPYFAIQMLHSGGMNGVFLLAAIAPAIALPLFPFLKITPSDEEETLDDASLPLFDKLIERKVLPISAICLLVYFGFSSVLSFVAVFTTEIGLERTASYIFVIYAITLVVSRPFVSKLFDKRGPDIILYPGIALLATGLLVLSQTGSDLSLIISSALFGVGLGAVQVGTLALVVDIVPRHRLAVANATYYMSLDGATAIGPVFAGMLIAPFGFRGMYLTMFVIIACCIPLYRLLSSRLKEAR